jgi:O-antigen/teichoic acid export membrane protein
LNSSKQIKIGALISYGTIAFHIIAGLIYTPWMISKIGQSDFGIYTLATTLITMFVMDFGLGAAVSRFVSKYRAENRQDMVNNFVGLVYKLYLHVDAVILVALLAVYCCMDIVYGNLTPEELEKLRVLYVIVASFSVISFPFSNLNGIITAYESFIALKLCDFFNKALTILLIVIALLFDMGVYALVTVNALVATTVWMPPTLLQTSQLTSKSVSGVKFFSLIII